MATRGAAAIRAALIQKGMVEHDNHHHMLRKRVEGVTHLVTRVSHGGSGEIGDHLASLMAKQCCLRLKEFYDLLDCPMSEESWDALVAERCSGGRNPFLGR